MLKKVHPFNWIVAIILLVAVGIWLYMSFGYIYEEHVTEATLEEKSHDDDGYYVTIDGEEIVVEDESLWMVLEEDEDYEVTYEWYGQKQPYMVDINQAHDDDSVGGGH
ncbi:hypothetical protein GCM10010954_20600 [Halobacillus andaensis]|uniref:Uncharacterized protein n=1 Tax=Halobacillus andaensis TaxID=1176239 RepID=A0A917B3W4_HALAA|nr:hypothetical protein [Halobacillus andaensis]MBP2004433.1 hypothetical protein [Halobacillus andaensis]GGF21671.1 hypothetical protein GCM10010954_20600 [Halobacillus andaensis]